MADIKDPENTLILETSKGPSTIELRPDLAPGHVTRIKELARAGLLRRADIPPRHRRLHGADRRSDRAPAPAARARSSRRSFRAEKHVRGTVSMARSQSPEFRPTASSSSASTRRRCLNRQYTVWGQVIDGHGATSTRSSAASRSDDPDTIVTMRVAADAA